FVEAALVPGDGELTITGQLGDVMRESVRAAVTYARSRSAQLGVDPGWPAETDIHIHVPEGAVPKDGPSAGVTMTTALRIMLVALPALSALVAWRLARGLRAVDPEPERPTDGGPADESAQKAVSA
ncbi:MAG: hypothetical protein KY395_08120, partial [Actinobacteria bacterium]|nr:hypothetical protein [Actinomycetota bacterium]